MLIPQLNTSIYADGENQTRRINNTPVNKNQRNSFQKLLDMYLLLHLLLSNSLVITDNSKTK